MNGSAKVLITGIGCVGKSTLRRRVAEAFGRKVVCIDRDDADSEPEVAPGQVLVIESVHGLDEPPESWGLVVYLLPPRGHTLRWIRRGIAWFRTGKVDRPPQVERRSWSLQNIPLIVRLVKRNVWNASRWVKEDRKRIEKLFPNGTIVTDDADLAFREVNNFISRAYEKRKDMVESEEITEKISKEKLQEWVRDSIELDLIYDEEQEEPPAEFKVLPNKPEPLPEREITNVALWIKCFSQLKGIRIRDGLSFDHARKDFANADPETSNSRGIYENLVEAKNIRNNNLDTIMWRCASAIDVFRSWAPNKKDDKVNKATLIALFHSELCASGTPDVNWGQARSFHKTVTDGAIGYPIFKWIAQHNVARGYNHFRSYVDAVKMIDEWVDNFPENAAELANSINCEEDLLYRALFFPASLTFSQALDDMGRYAEGTFYLWRAYQYALTRNYSYWSEFIQEALDVRWIDSKIMLKLENEQLIKRLNEESASPRIQSDRWTALSLLTDKLIKKPDWISTCWMPNEMRLLRWHYAEPRPFSRHLQAMSENVYKIMNDLEGRLSSRDLDSIQQVLVFALKGPMQSEKNGVAATQLDNLWKKTPIDSPQRYLEGLWMQFRSLFMALKKLEEELIGQSKDSNSITEWKNELEVELKDEKYISFRSEANKIDILPEDFECLNKKCTILLQRQKFSDYSKAVQETTYGGNTNDQIENCDLGCPARILDPDEQINFSKDIPHVVHWNYYKSIMAAQQERFLSYIKPRTGRERYYRQGEAMRKSPKFEIICLRRWNSFSPNLGSRAAVTVGGGYLVRAWYEANKRYIGIAVDPGYNFLENLFNEGFTIPDIDLVVITHAHPDHIENFTNLITLLREREKRLKKGNNNSPQEQRLLIATTEGVFERFRLHLDAEKEFIHDIVVLTAKNHYRGNKAGKEELCLWLDDEDVLHMNLYNDVIENRIEQNSTIILSAARTLHFDGTDYDTIGIVMKYKNSENEISKIGIIGDTRYSHDLVYDYEDSKVLVTHLGGLVDESMYLDKDLSRKTNDDLQINNDELLDLIKKKNHLYLPGLAFLICQLQKKNNDSKKFPLMILSEFGEELRGGLRKDLASRLSYYPFLQGEGDQKNRLPIIPGDVGLRVDIESRKVFCCICNRYVEPNYINTEIVTPDEESMAYVCNDCKKSRRGELTKLIEEWCRTARPVVPLKEKEETNKNDSKESYTK